MLIDIVTDNTENSLMQYIERTNKQGAMSTLAHFRFSEFHVQPNRDDFVLAVKESLIGYKAAIYFCSDGDVFVIWRGPTRNILKPMVEKVKRTFSAQMMLTQDDFPFNHYDMLAHGEELRIICKNKLHPQPRIVPPSNNPLPDSGPPIPTAAENPSAGQPIIMTAIENMPVKPVVTATPIIMPGKNKSDWQAIDAPLKFTRDQIITLPMAIESRKERKVPEILIVEDQTFSRLLLHSSLRENYVVHSTENAKEAVQIYADVAPDIVFLDIELPDGSGHQLAELFKSIDKNAFIVMVTAHNAREDVIKAKDNGAKAFVLKPYNKQKIFDCIHLFQRHRKKAN